VDASPGPLRHDVEDLDEVDWPTDVEQESEAGVAAADPTAATPTEAPPALSEREEAILAFERQWWRYAGAKEQAIRDLFHMSPTRYYQTLNALLDDPAALAHDPALVKRLRRLRATRSRTRSRG
jgi:hypothetical protein